MGCLARLTRPRLLPSASLGRHPLHVGLALADVVSTGGREMGASFMAVKQNVIYVATKKLGPDGEAELADREAQARASLRAAGIDDAGALVIWDARSSPGRPGLQRLRELGHQNALASVSFARLSDVSRKSSNALDVLLELREGGVRLFSATEFGGEIGQVQMHLLLTYLDMHRYLNRRRAAVRRAAERRRTR